MTQTPKANKKTPKKINVKETPLKKDKTTMTPKTKNTPAEGSITVCMPHRTAIPPKVLLEMLEGSENVTFIIHKIVIKYNLNDVSKKLQELGEVKIEGRHLNVHGFISQEGLLKRKIYLNDPAAQEKVQEFFNATSIENFRRKNKETKFYILTFETKEEAEAASKKQFHLGNKKHVGLTPFYEFESSREGKYTPAEGSIAVCMPPYTTIPTKVLLEMLEGSENVSFRPNKIVMKYNLKDVSKKLKELREVKIEGEHLDVHEFISKESLLKRRICLNDPAAQEKVKKFFNATSIENLRRKNKESKFYLLTFKTKEEAEAASEKQFHLGNEEHVGLTPFYEFADSLTESSGGGKVKSEELDQKQTPYKSKLGKNARKKRKAEEESVEVNSETPAQKRTPSHTKSKKNSQKKRKAEEEEEKSDNDIDGINTDDSDEDEE